MSITVCWSAKGGSGTTVFAACLALHEPAALLVDLAGDAPAVIGLPEPAGQGVGDWLASDAPLDALDDLVVDVDGTTRLLPCGDLDGSLGSSRWGELAHWLHDAGNVVVDAGVGPPPPALRQRGRGLLVTRACYLALRHATAHGVRPDGVVLIAEPGRRLRPRDVARSLGAPVVMTVSVDPAIARAVDAGLLRGRLPRSLRHELVGVAA